jgi:hypothetical protein
MLTNTVVTDDGLTHLEGLRPGSTEPKLPTPERLTFDALCRGAKSVGLGRSKSRKATNGSLSTPLD